MQIVIEIPKELIAANKFYTNDEIWDIVKCVHNGVPLPEHHGRLIDADALMDLAQNSITKTVDCNDIGRFPTVVEATKEDK